MPEILLFIALYWFAFYRPLARAGRRHRALQRLGCLPHYVTGPFRRGRCRRF
jgi:hypothetical protein